MSDEEEPAPSAPVSDNDNDNVQRQSVNMGEVSFRKITEAKKEKIKLRFLVADRSFAQLKVMLDQVADDYTRKVRHGVTTLLFLSMGISLVGVCCMVHDREMNTLIV